jgi:DNA-binding transcriptional ArsR family regulator
MERRNARARWAEIFSALASEQRLRIVELLAQGEVQCQEILKHVDLSQPAISYHLGKLERAGVLRKERAGSRRCYRLNEELKTVFECLMKENGSWNTR